MKHLMHKPGMTSLEDGSPEPPFWERYVSRTVKNNLVAALSEFVGTTMFLLIAFGGTVCPPTLFCHTACSQTDIFCAKTDTTASLRMSPTSPTVCSRPDTLSPGRRTMALTAAFLTTDRLGQCDRRRGH
jgi:hypothetical protein